MNEISLQSGSQPELRFSGQLIAETKFDVDLGDEQRRGFDLRVYAIADGGFVSTLRYQSTSELENQIFWYEDMDQFKDVENFFFVFEANEIIPGYDRLSRIDRARAASTCKLIANAYDASLYKFLDRVRNQSYQHNFADRAVEKANRPSILRALGLKR